MSHGNLKTLIGEINVPSEESVFIHCYENFLAEIWKDRMLSAKDKMLIYIGVCLSQGCSRSMTSFLLDQIKNLHISANEIMEILKIATLSRGITPLTDGFALFAELANYDESTETMGEASTLKSADAIMEYFRSRFSKIPAWVEILGKHFPRILENYHLMRSHAVDEGILSRKIKELILIAVNAADIYDEGMKIHINGALQSGASREEIWEALLVAMIVGGVVSWIAGISAMKEVGVL
jgi:alkylhydroperoxidase/carboxymuconolactone decarboxylase family protein YurZ